MTGMPSSKQQRIAQELARLAVLDRAGCLDLWKTLFDCEAPRYLSAVFMRKALAHEAQCRMLGGLAAADICALRSIAGGKRSAVRSAPVLSAGTHLVREWNGRTYQVEVSRSGYVMDGKSFTSLTAIARRITGANWSGPRFFGLVDRSNRHGDGDKSRFAADQGGEQAGNEHAERELVDSVPSEPGLTDSYDSSFSRSARAGLTGSSPADAQSPRP
jgi:hypothetical protein